MNRPYTQTAATPTHPTVTALFHRVLRQLFALLRQELTLARAELIQSLMPLLSSAGTILAGGVLLYAGVALLLTAALFGLALFMPMWLAALGLGVTVSIIGAVLVVIGRQHLRNAHLAPTHLPHSLRKDKDVLLGRRQS